MHIAQKEIKKARTNVMDMPAHSLEVSARERYECSSHLRHTA